MAIFIDEFGFWESSVARKFIPRLVTNATKPDVDMRLIVCHPIQRLDESIRSLLDEFGINNQKYSRDWHSIHVPRLNHNEINALISFLWHRAQSIASANIDQIARLSEGKPMSVQRVCSALWNAEANDESDAELTKILGTKQRYED